MKLGVLKLLLPLVLLSSAALSAAQQPGAAVAVVPGSLQDIVRKPLVLRGTLGDDKIQLSLRPKVDEDGLEGQYFIFGQGSQILLAGEVDQNDLMMEESHNGKDVSGQWEGSFKNGVLSGTWSTLDGSVTKPFSLKAGVQ
ncbi:hypothetical protein [Herbaspirillum rhizosphaerae]|uniref:hypothetical protein n=1 Tax=Herbaspirillum rhizosphaerae TaxID=346179 RepID=UPI00067E5E78|nr:hypothetical protein [Herbaspirillum rhizosphaerae]